MNINILSRPDQLGTVGSIKIDTTRIKTNGSNASQPGASLPHDGAPHISHAGRFLSKLHQLQQQDPAQFEQVISSLTAQLQQAAQTAQGQGNTSLAGQLNQLAGAAGNGLDTSNPTLHGYGGDPRIEPPTNEPLHGYGGAPRIDGH